MESLQLGLRGATNWKKTGTLVSGGVVYGGGGGFCRARLCQMQWIHRP